MQWWKKRRDFKHGLRAQLMKEQRGKCYYCGSRVFCEPAATAECIPPNYATLDHIIPRSKGAGLADNAVVACFRCNNERGDRDAREFLFEKMGIA